MKAIRIHTHGGPESMRWEEVQLPAPGAGEARIRHTAIAVNFSDINQRRGGFYTSAPMPMRSSSATRRRVSWKASAPASAT